MVMKGDVPSSLKNDGKLKNTSVFIEMQMMDQATNPPIVGPTIFQFCFTFALI